ncbi:MAG: hypothetical protein Q4F61_03400 [Candidatus Saccharibacteria bacterium]|nr:hypothetical protein [Candidatus Saccharibacteria bacterium]
MKKVILRLTKNRQIRVCLFVLLLFACELLFVGQSKFAYAILPDTPVKFSLLKKIDLGGWTQGATITKKYFIYTETVKSDGSEYARLHRCKWPSFSSCDKTVKAKVNHANILDAKWGSNYFWVLDTRNHKTPRHHWCFDSETMKQVSDSKCGEMLPERNITKKNGGKLDSTLT